MARAKDADELRVVVGEGPGVDDSAGRGGVVAPIDFVLRSVGVGDPYALGVAEVAVDVFPAVVDDASVGEERGMSFKERALSNLLDVGTVRVHLVEIAHDMAVAHAVFRLARGGEDDFPRGEISGVYIGRSVYEGELSESRNSGDLFVGRLGKKRQGGSVEVEIELKFGNVVVVEL